MMLIISGQRKRRHVPDEGGGGTRILQNSRRHLRILGARKADMKQVRRWGPTNIRCHSTEIRRFGARDLCIFAPGKNDPYPDEILERKVQVSTTHAQLHSAIRTFGRHQTSSSFQNLHKPFSKSSPLSSTMDSFFNGELSVAERAVPSILMQHRCRPLYGQQFRNKNVLHGTHC